MMVFREAHMAQPNHAKANDTKQEQRMPKKPETFHVVQGDNKKPAPAPEIKLAGNLAFQETWIAPPSTERPALKLVPTPEVKKLSEEETEKKIIERARELDTLLDVDLLREHLRKGDTEKQWFTRIRIAAEQELRDSKNVSLSLVIRDRKDCHDPEPDASQVEWLDAVVSRSKVMVIGLKFHPEDASIPAVFKPKDGEPIWTEKNGTTRGLLEDRLQGGYLREWFAGFLAKAIGSQVVPPTVIREINGAIGSVQSWVEGSLAADCLDWPEKTKEIELQELAVIDFLLQNLDRHLENFFIENDWSNKGIDHAASLPAPNYEAGPVRSFPLRHFSDKKAELLPDLRERLARTFNNGPREELIQKALHFIFGEKDGQIVFDQLIERDNKLIGIGRFPEYKMRDSDEILFTQIIEKASTVVDSRPKRKFDTSR